MQHHLYTIQADAAAIRAAEVQVLDVCSETCNIPQREDMTTPIRQLFLNQLPVK
jgi:hypothetical protein